MDWQARPQVSFIPYRHPFLSSSHAPPNTAPARGIPLYLFEVKHLDNKSVAEYERTGASHTFSKADESRMTAPPGLLRLFALYENLTHFVMPFCSQLQDRQFPGTPITMTTNIVDISGVGLKQFWNLKAHMQAASQLATAHYPETLDSECFPPPRFCPHLRTFAVARKKVQQANIFPLLP